MATRVNFDSTVEYWIRRTPMILRDTCDVYYIYNEEGNGLFLAFSNQFLKCGRLASGPQSFSQMREGEKLYKITDWAWNAGNTLEEAVKALRDTLSTGGKFEKEISPSGK